MKKSNVSDFLVLSQTQSYCVKTVSCLSQVLMQVVWWDIVWFYGFQPLCNELPLSQLRYKKWLFFNLSQCYPYEKKRNQHHQKSQGT